MVHHSDEQILTMAQAAFSLEAGSAPLHAWWLAHAALHAELPTRADLPGAACGPDLAQAFLAEGLGGSVLRIQLAGRSLAGLQTVPLAGLPLSCLFLPEARPLLAEAAMLVLTGQAAVALNLQTEPRLLRPSLHGRLMLLPVRPQRIALHPCEVLGVFSPELTGSGMARRFAITGVEAQAVALSGGRRLSEILPQYPARPVLVAECQDLPHRIPSRSRRRDHLRLVHAAP